MISAVTVLGAGPAGSAAALAALENGSGVTVYDPARFPRQKVCGEFLSPEIAGVLDTLGVWSELSGSHPATIRRMKIFMGRAEVSHVLPETAYGLSRGALDSLLLDNAVRRGATLVPGKRRAARGPTVVATGRTNVSTAGQKRDNRLFGFKAHFQGASEDSVELHFFHGGYVGLSPVENGATNVCGLATVRDLRASGFDFDELLARSARLRDRLDPLRRTMDWLTTGPLVYGRHSRRAVAMDIYPAGDAVNFVDPFTGSGLLSAVLTGAMAGAAAARTMPSDQHLSRCRRTLGIPFTVASLFRRVLKMPGVDLLLRIVPPSLLYGWTRPIGPARLVTLPRW